MHSLKPIQILLDGHKKIRGLFRQVMVQRDRAPEMKASLVEELLLELGLQRIIHEEYFDPLFSDVVTESERGQVGRVEERLREIQSLVGGLRRLDMETQEFDRGMTDLRKTVELYFEQEERDLLPIAAAHSEFQSEALATEMEKRREGILRAPRFRDSLPSHAQNPKGGEQKRKRVAEGKVKANTNPSTNR